METFLKALLALLFLANGASAGNGIPNDHAKDNSNAHQGHERSDPHPAKGNDTTFGR